MANQSIGKQHSNEIMHKRMWEHAMNFMSCIRLHPGLNKHLLKRTVSGLLTSRKDTNRSITQRII